MKHRNFRTHVTSLTMNKLADGLFDPKLVLAWLLTHLGSSALWVGLLVPVREAGALLPQLFIAEQVRRMSIRKWAWILGSVMQGLAAAGIALTALLVEGERAGMLIVFWVALLAIARSVGSVSYKDVLGKTVEKSYRGQVSGTATAIAAFGVFTFGTLLFFDVIDRFVLVIAALVSAASLWVFAATWFSRLVEEKSIIKKTHIRHLLPEYWHYLRTDNELQRFIVTRTFLLATALAPPYLVLLMDRTQQSESQLGLLVIASATAAMLSGRVWGIWSDRSTRFVLMLAGVTAGLALTAAVFSVSYSTSLHWLVLPGILFIVMISYQGVRIGRTTHLTNIASDETRAAYTAIANTLIGIALLFTGAFGAIAQLVSLPFMVGVLAAMCFLGAVTATRLQI